MILSKFKELSDICMLICAMYSNFVFEFIDAISSGIRRYFSFDVSISRAIETCCPGIGCFTNDPPFESLPLPWCIEEINPSYTMYTRANAVVGESFDHATTP